jgi:hypothetical protein
LLTSAVILHLGTGSLAATRKGHSRARHFGAIFTFLVQIFFACGTQHIISTQCFIWEVGIAAASMEACVMRVLPSNAFVSPAGTILLGISAASSSFGRSMARRRDRLSCSHLCSASRLPSSRCSHWPEHCALLVLCGLVCMERAWKFAAFWILLAMLDAGAVCVMTP